MDSRLDKQTAENQRIGSGKAGPGRPKGTPNRITAVLKDAIIQAATDAGDGDLVAYLKRQANENPVAFMGLLGKVLPLQVEGAAAIVYDVSDEPLSEDDWADRHGGGVN